MNALVAFFLGQLSLALLIFAFIKFFIFGPPPERDPNATGPSLLSVTTPSLYSNTPSTTATSTRRRSSIRPSSSYKSHISPSTGTPGSGGGSTPSGSLRHKRSALLRPSTPSGSTSFPPPHPASILRKTFYSETSHQPESVDWFNVLVAQTLAQLRAEALHEGAIEASLTALLNGPARPDFVGDVAVTEIALGDEFPLFSNCRIIPVDDTGAQTRGVGEGTRLLARLDVDLSDAITLGVETTLRLNYPRPLVATLPVALAISIVKFSGTVCNMSPPKSMK